MNNEISTANLNWPFAGFVNLQQISTNPSIFCGTEITNPKFGSRRVAIPACPRRRALGSVPSERPNVHASVYIPASSKGCCLNPRGWCIGTPYHPFSTPWKIQVGLKMMGAKNCGKLVSWGFLTPHYDGQTLEFRFLPLSGVRVNPWKNRRFLSWGVLVRDKPNFSRNISQQQTPRNIQRGWIFPQCFPYKLPESPSCCAYQNGWWTFVGYWENPYYKKLVKLGNQSD